MSTSQPTSNPRRTKAKAEAKTAMLSETITLPLDRVVPYWRNPRVITDEAVNAVAESITRYGYQQPIVVDEANVIIIGHTRYSALRRLGVKEVQVVVADLPAHKVKQLRVMDNKAKEFTSWNFEALVSELADLDAELMFVYFPEAQIMDVDGNPTVGAPADLPESNPWDDVERTAEFICPSCFHSWEMEVTREAVMSGKLEVQQ